MLKLLLIPLLAQSNLIPESMLHQADWISKKYTLEIAKAPPPPPLSSTAELPQYRICLVHHQSR